MSVAFQIFQRLRIANVSLFFNCLDGWRATFVLAGKASYRSTLRQLLLNVVKFLASESRGGPSFVSHIYRVLFGRANTKMIRIRAFPVVAGMHDENRIGYLSSEVEKMGNAMRSACPLIYSELPVSMRAAASGPVPAAIRRFLNVVVESAPQIAELSVLCKRVARSAFSASSNQFSLSQGAS